MTMQLRQLCTAHAENLDLFPSSQAKVTPLSLQLQKG